MAVGPILETSLPGPSAALIANLAGADMARVPEAGGVDGTEMRRLSIYPSSAGFDMVEELAFLAGRAIEPNAFFNPLFLAPAMPRLEDRTVRLAVIRDAGRGRERLRFLMPFSIERPGLLPGLEVIRVWSHPFGPLGTPLVDPDDPPGLMHDVFELLARRELGLPKILVLPDLRMEGPVARLVRETAAKRTLPLAEILPYRRAVLAPEDGAVDYLRQSLSSHHFRGYRRLRRRLAEQGELKHEVADRPDAIRLAFERFLVLEASGWKGRRGTAMAIDRLQSAFAREAINGLAGKGLCRIHELVLNGETIASLVVLLEAGEAYTWKTAFDERHAAFSPGTLLMLEVTGRLLGDPSVKLADSCAIENHPVMDRLWTERRAMGTLVVGLERGSERRVALASARIERRHHLRELAKRSLARLRRGERREAEPAE